MRQSHMGLDFNLSNILSSAGAGIQEGLTTQIMQTPEFKAQASALAQKSASQKVADWILAHKMQLAWAGGILGAWILYRAVLRK